MKKDNRIVHEGTATYKEADGSVWKPGKAKYTYRDGETVYLCSDSPTMVSPPIGEMPAPELGPGKKLIFTGTDLINCEIVD